LERTKIQEELRQEREARKALEVQVSIYQKELNREEHVEFPLHAEHDCDNLNEQQSPSHSDNDYNDIDQPQKSLKWTPLSSRGSFSIVKEERDQLKEILEDRDMKMVEKKYQVEVLRKKLGSFINAWNGATEESVSLRNEMSEIRKQLKFGKTQVKELEMTISNREEENSILKRRRDNAGKLGENKHYQDRIIFLEKRLKAEQSRHTKKMTTSLQRIMKVQQQLEKTTQVVEKLKKENRTTKALQKELSHARTEKLYMSEMVSSLELKLLNTMDMENNYEKMFEELSFKTTQIRKLEIQRMALEDVLRTTNMDALMNKFVLGKKKSRLQNPFSKISVWKKSDQLADDNLEALASISPLKIIPSKMAQKKNGYSKMDAFATTANTANTNVGAVTPNC